MTPKTREWQSIESAPRDGTVILLALSNDALCGYSSRVRPTKAIAIGMFDLAWVIGVPGGHSYGGGDNQFIGWQPLPAAPEPPGDAR